MLKIKCESGVLRSVLDRPGIVGIGEINEGPDMGTFTFTLSPKQVAPAEGLKTSAVGLSFGDAAYERDEIEFLSIDEYLDALEAGEGAASACRHTLGVFSVTLAAGMRIAQVTLDYSTITATGDLAQRTVQAMVDRDWLQRTVLG